MISSSPSPTLHATSPHHAASHRPHFARSRPSQSPTSPFSRPGPSQRQVSPKVLQQQLKNKRSSGSSGSTRNTRDAGTQYSPPQEIIAASPIPSKRKERVELPEHEPSEPVLRNKPEEVEEKPQVSRPGPEQGPESLSMQQIAVATPGTLSSSNSSMTAGSATSSKRPRPSMSMEKKIMPLQYELCDVKDLVRLIAAMLMELIRYNDDIPLQDGRLTRFHSRAPPGISVMDYLQRLTTHATLSPPILLSMVFYIDRLCVLYPEFTISSLTVHRYLIASATVASKGLSDSFWTNNTYARVGGVSLKELALLELEFLWRLEWRIVPKPEVLVDYYRSLVERSDGFEMEQESSGEDDDQQTES